MTLNSLIQVNDKDRARQYDFGTTARAVKDEEDSDERHTNGLTVGKESVEEGRRRDMETSVEE